jgi:hypothetical protein
MRTLTLDQFETSRRFMKTAAQDIDSALFEHAFEGRSREDVATVLASYQNPDGGFGMLDYDMENPCSCLKHCESACRYLFKLDLPGDPGLPGDPPLIANLMTYLLAHYHPQTGQWDDLLVPEVNDYPHARWWTYEEETRPVPRTRAELVAQYDPNTYAALAAFVLKYRSLVPGDLVEAITSVPLEKVRSGADFSPYDVLSLSYLINELDDDEEKAELLDILIGKGRLVELLGPAPLVGEDAYKLVHLIDSPDHPAYPVYRSYVDQTLDHLIGAQQADGTWQPNWRWGDDAVWERVERRLKGSLTVQFLGALHRFGRLEGL